jgi:hypothetical protein
MSMRRRSGRANGALFGFAILGAAALILTVVVSLIRSCEETAIHAVERPKPHVTRFTPHNRADSIDEAATGEVLGSLVARLKQVEASVPFPAGM